MMLNEVLPCANPFNEQEMAIMNNDKEESFQGEGGQIGKEGGDSEPSYKFSDDD